MKNFTQIILLFLFTIVNVYGQQEKGIVGRNNWLNNWTEFKSSQNDYGEPTQILAGNISEDTTLSKREVYLLLGSVFVTNNATVTIEPGTIILGDFKTKGSLTVTKGARILAKGQETDPIIFTSNRAIKRSGDWGGLILLGEAPINKLGRGSVASYYPKLNPREYANVNYGGKDTLSDSGVLNYVRIEYAGKRVSANDYFSGLLLASVGKNTIISNIMVSHSGGHAFEVWGGDVKLNRLVSYKSNGNDFLFNHGSRAMLKNSLAVRSPYASSVNGSRCLKVVSYNDINEFDFNKRKTFISAKNLTFLNESADLNQDISMNLVREGIYVGNSSILHMSKSVISGFNPAVVLNEEININENSLKRIKFSEMYFNNCKGNIFVENNSNNEDLENWYGNNSFFNVYSKSNNAETFIDIEDRRRPDFRLRINKIIATNIDRDLMDE